MVSIIKLGGFKNHPNGIVRLTCEDVIRLPMRHTPLMRTSVSLYHRHRFPAEIISHSVWLYFRFALSFRDVEEMLAMRGVTLSYETIREWCLKIGQTYANGLRRRSSRPRDRWHLDEVFLRSTVGSIISGVRLIRTEMFWIFLSRLGETRRAAKKFFRKLLKGLRYVPRVLITDKLKSYSAARADVMPSVEHWQQKYQNNRAENSHQQLDCGSG